MRVHPSDSLSLQSGKSPLHRSSPAGSRLALVLICKSHRKISERPVTPRVEITNHIPSANSRTLSQWLILFLLEDTTLRPQRGLFLGREKRCLECVALCLLTLFSGQSSGGGCCLKLIPKVDGADAGIVGVDRGEQAMIKHGSQRMARQ